MMKEKRAFILSNIEVRGDPGKQILSGYAAVFNKLSVPMMGFREIIRPGAFGKSVKEDDIRILWNHDPNLVLGRNTSGTLRLVEDAEGLKIENDLPDTQIGHDARETIRRGDVNQMSFSFRTISDRWFTQDGEDRRELLEVKVFEVSPVTFPAYPETQVSARAIMAAGIDVNRLTAALRAASTGQEVRADDAAALDAAYEIINGFRSKKQKPNEISREARYELLRRRLALEAL